MVRMLIDAKADKNAKNDEGQTALMLQQGLIEKMLLGY